MVSAHDERRLLDVLQIREAFSRLRSPLADGGNLCWCDLVADRGIAVLSAGEVALQEGSPSRLTLSITFLQCGFDDFLLLPSEGTIKLLTRLPACPNARGTGNVEKVIKVNWLTL